MTTYKDPSIEYCNGVNDTIEYIKDHLMSCYLNGDYFDMYEYLKKLTCKQIKRSKNVTT